MGFHDVIRQRREELGLSQEDLARQVGLSQVAISKIEAGGKTRHIVAIARALKLEPSRLSDGIAEDVPEYSSRPQLSDRALRIAELFDALPAEYQDEVYRRVQEATLRHADEEQKKIKKLRELAHDPVESR